MQFLFRGKPSASSSYRPRGKHTALKLLMNFITEKGFSNEETCSHPYVHYDIPMLWSGPTLRYWKSGLCGIYRRIVEYSPPFAAPIVQQRRKMEISQFEMNEPLVSFWNLRTQLSKSDKNSKRTKNLHFNGFPMSCVFVLMVISEIHKEGGPQGVITKRSFKHTSNNVHQKRVKEAKNMKASD